MTSHHLNRRAILAGAASVAAPVPALAVARDQASSTPLQRLWTGVNALMWTSRTIPSSLPSPRARPPGPR